MPDRGRQKRPHLTKAQVKLAKDSTQFQVRVDKYRNKLGGGPGALEFFGAYAQGAYNVLAHLYESGVSLAHEYNSVDKVVAALGRGSSVVLAQLYKAAAFASWFYTKSTEDERRQFFDQVKADFARKTGEVWDGLQTGIQQSVGTWLEKVYAAYTSGDWESLFHVLGEGAGTGFTETAIQMAEWELAIGAVKQTGALARTINRYRIQSGVLEALKGVPAGRILQFSEMQRLWGLALEDYEAFKKIAEEEGVVIGVRSRAPISVQNLEDGAVWKHEELKPKNVSEIDHRYLGFDKGDYGLVAFRTYTPAEQAAIRANIATLPKAERAVVNARFETRLAEHEYVPKIEQLNQQHRINVGFNYADNGLVLENTSNVRAFALKARDRGRRDVLPTAPGEPEIRCSRQHHGRAAEVVQAAAREGSVPGERRHGRRLSHRRGRPWAQRGQAVRGLQAIDGGRLAAPGDAHVDQEGDVRLRGKIEDPPRP